MERVKEYFRSFWDVIWEGVMGVAEAECNFIDQLVRAIFHV